jgi:oxygen-independent coproporphyrinogen-3 oxidase
MPTVGMAVNLSYLSTMHLYLHVPFCARRCSYCDFAIAVRRETPSEEYVDRVLAEWARWRAEPRWCGFPELHTLYLGGGTPSRLAPESLTRLVDRLQEDRPLAPAAEVTLEANPEDVTPAVARAWRAAGFNRVSLGVQSFEPAVLTWMHRTHDAAQVPRAVAALREAGFDNLSLDLIYSLPSALSRDWSRDLDQALALAPEHLSLYGLTVEEHTPLGHWVARGEARPSPDERYADEFLLAHRVLTGAGFRHYEVSNYGLPGREAVHNRAYWRRAPYLGLGPSAHSGIGASRWWNLRDWSEWSRAIAAGLPAVAASEELSREAVAIEDLYLGLRTDTGVPVAMVDGTTFAGWLAEGWAEVSGDRVRLTAEGWLRLDALVGATDAK